MVYKNFRLNCIIRILAITVSILLLLLLLFDTGYYITSAAIAVIIMLQVLSLIHYVEKTNREVTRFLDAVRYSDFSQTFNYSGMGASFKELQDSFNDVLSQFHKIRIEKEEHFNYLKTVVRHIGIALITFDESGNIDLLNTASQKLFRQLDPGAVSLKDLSSLKKVSPELYRSLTEAHPGEKTLLKLKAGSELIQLSVSTSKVKLREKEYTVISLQNISTELEANEIEAWQNLIKVLTHEIMNSITPITSLASTLDETLTQSGDTALSPPDKHDLRKGIQTIKKRSQGLLHFVDAYRDLSKVPAPHIKPFSVKEMFSSVGQFLAPSLGDSDIKLISSVEPDSLILNADRELIEQALINLALNSIKALDGIKEPYIRMSAGIDGKGKTLIRVSDNGKGIPPDIIDNIFVPFFTTTKNGTGIGLSLVKQIMRLHNAAVSVSSKEGQETEFKLSF